MVSVPKVQLNNGYEIPVLGLGTYQSLDGDVEAAVSDAIDNGYRHIDTAFLYGNEEEIGRVIRRKIDEGVVTRKELFITSKLWSNFHDSNRVEYACRLSLKKLGLNYLDLYLIHWPFAVPYVNDTEFWPKDEAGGSLYDDSIDYIDTWKAMEELVRKGLVRSIGVSNFNSQQLKRVLDVATIKPVTNQVECSPSINQKKLIKFCNAYDVKVTAYSPLGRPNIENKTPKCLFDEKMHTIAKKYNKSVYQVNLRYLLQLGTIVIPKSIRTERIKDNINVFDFNLSSDDMELIDQYNDGTRTAQVLRLKQSAYHPFNIEF